MKLILAFTTLLKLYFIVFEEKFCRASSDEDTPWGIQLEENQTPWSAWSYNAPNSGNRPKGHSQFKIHSIGDIPVQHSSKVVDQSGSRKGSVLLKGSVPRFDKDSQVKPKHTSSVDQEPLHRSFDGSHAIKFNSLPFARLMRSSQEKEADDIDGKTSQRDASRSKPGRRWFGKLSKQQLKKVKRFFFGRGL